MRGSPFIRFIVLAFALALAAVGLMRVTSARGNDDASALAAQVPKDSDHQMVPFRLLLSAPAAEVAIDTGRMIRPQLEGPSISGNLELDPTSPRLGLVVRWKNPAAAGEHRFAKVTLEVPGQDTFTHVFDAGGDIDEFLELPLPAAK